MLRDVIMLMAPKGATDPYFANVSLLMHFDGADASTTFTDVKGHTVTPSGDAQIDTAQSLFGGASGLFDGTGDYLTITNDAALQFGSGDFTIEGAFRTGASTPTEVIFCKRAAAAARGVVCYWDSGANTFYWLIGDTDTGGWNVTIQQGGSLGNDTWHRTMLTRSGTTYSGYLDGTSIGQVVWAGTIADDTSDILLAASNGAGVPWLGHLDEWRITKGVARQTGASYVLDTAAFPNS